jgi:hypothetical protein
VRTLTEPELEVASRAVLADGCQNAYDVSVTQDRSPVHALELVSTTKERSVDTPAVDDLPTPSRALQDTVSGSRDELLGIGLKRDVVQLR